MRNRQIRRFDPCSRRGMVAVLVALLMPVVVGVMALSLDGGLLYLQRRQAQSAADAAALAGAYQLYNGSNFSVAQTSAIAMGTQNGFTIPSTSVTQPADGVYRGDGHVQPAAALQRHVGGGERVGHGQCRRPGDHRRAYSKAAILVLATRAARSRSRVRRRSPPSMAASSSIRPRPRPSSRPARPPSRRPTLDLSGNILYSGTNPNKATVTKYSQPSTPDPLASIAAPSSSGHDHPSYSAISLSGSAAKTLLPGVYTAASRSAAPRPSPSPRGGSTTSTAAGST